MNSATHLIPGTGTVPSAGPYIHNWPHQLGTEQPNLALFELAQVTPPVWRFKPPVEFDARSVDANNLTLTFASTPPTQGHVGALKIIALAIVLTVPLAAGLVSSGQLAGFRARASALLAGTFPTLIAIGDRINIPAARWSLTSSAEHELAGLLPSPDVAIRVELAAIDGLDIIEGRTRLTEDGRTMRVERIRAAKGDPGIVLECKAA